MYAHQPIIWLCTGQTKVKTSKITSSLFIYWPKLGLKSSPKPQQMHYVYSYQVLPWNLNLGLGNLFLTSCFFPILTRFFLQNIRKKLMKITVFFIMWDVIWSKLLPFNLNPYTLSLLLVSNEICQEY